jgi:hypothetical protein
MPAASGMRKYVREMLQDLIGKKDKSYIPPIPKASGDPATADLNAPPQPSLPGDLSNQVLSKNRLQRTKQLDYQAQKDEERESS